MNSPKESYSSSCSIRFWAPSDIRRRHAVEILRLRFLGAVTEWAGAVGLSWDRHFVDSSLLSITPSKLVSNLLVSPEISWPSFFSDDPADSNCRLPGFLTVLKWLIWKWKRCYQLNISYLLLIKTVSKKDKDCIRSQGSDSEEPAPLLVLSIFNFSWRYFFHSCRNRAFTIWAVIEIARYHI